MKQKMITQTLVFSITLLLSAWLLFWVEPLLAKMLLPLLGGTPAVWNTSMMFYQGLLLLGYFYAFLVTRFLRLSHQVILHLILLALAALTLPIVIPDYLTNPDVHFPIYWLLTALTVVIGAPLFVLCATAPLLQHWFSTTQHRQAQDPYFLYAASNLGSMLSLLAYPFILERFLTLQKQSIDWSIGYGILFLCIMACASFLTFSKKNKSNHFSSEKKVAQPLTWQQQVRWILLAFVPSSLLLAVTTYLTTDVASIPLLWVIPLAIYLLTFILTFSQQPWMSHRLTLQLEPLMIALIMLMLVALTKFSSAFNLVVTLILQLFGFFIIAMVCHGELAKTRPSVDHLTTFYLWMAVGGLLGGIFNALIAPAIFNEIWEYPLVLIFACFLRPLISEKEKTPLIIVGMITTIIIIFSVMVAKTILYAPIDFFLKLEISLFLIANFLILFFTRKPLRYGTLVLILLFFGYFVIQPIHPILSKTRSFFGVYKIIIDNNKGTRQLWHGTTLHGEQYIQPEKQNIALTYYGKPMREIFSILPSSPRQIAMVGLGIGTTACYRRANDTFTFFEIDPAMLKIAENTRYFTYLKKCPPTRTMLGDARLTLNNEPDHVFDIIFLDAFSSDAIPMHLMTEEAVTLYLKKLKENGLLVFHISNRNLNLAPIVTRIAQELKLQSLTGQFYINSKIKNNDETSSKWIILARKPELVISLLQYPEWKIAVANPKIPLWRDDFSNIFSALN